MPRTRRRGRPQSSADPSSYTPTMEQLETILRRKINIENPPSPVREKLTRVSVSLLLGVLVWQWALSGISSLLSHHFGRELIDSVCAQSPSGLAEWVHGTRRMRSKRTGRAWGQLGRWAARTARAGVACRRVCCYGGRDGAGRCASHDPSIATARLTGCPMDMRPFLRVWLGWLG